jgi:hypothetical protein
MGSTVLYVRCARAFSLFTPWACQIQPRKLAVLFLWMPLIFPIAYWKRYFAHPDAELILARHARAAPGEMLELVNQLRTLLGKPHVATPDLDLM